MKTHSCVVIFLIFFLPVQSQSISKQYPQGYFRNPLDIPIQLVSNFGELRPNHFHMGLDIRTQGLENLPVHAAADGYVSRIKIEKYGYGNAIYINHPNGYSTLYAHLNTFFPALSDYVKARQYGEETWEQDFQLPAGLFPVTKGQLIAYSGNTGGSSGPHLHFEIRDTKTENNLNPLLFGFNIPDKKPPHVKSLFWYDRRYSTYTIAAKPIPIAFKNGRYTGISKVIKVNSPIVSLGIAAEDMMNNNAFNLGIYSAALYLDDSLIYAFTLDDFSYTDTRYVNACIDFSKYIKEKKYVQHLSVLPGNKLNIFSAVGSNGTIILTDTLPHSIKILLSDAEGNKSTVACVLQLSNISPAYNNFPKNAKPLLPNQENVISSNNVYASFDKDAFYDAIPFVLSENAGTGKNAASSFLALSNSAIPVHDSFNVRIRTVLPANSLLRNNTVMQLKSGTNRQTMKGNWQGDWMAGRFNRLGNIQLVIDTVPPTMVPVGWKTGSALTGAKKLVLKCKDDLDEIASFRAELDGHWLLFAKTNDDFIYTFDEHCLRGAHTLDITIKDIAGNTVQQRFTFTR